MPETPINWHRLLGLLLLDYFTETPFSVEIEKDLSFKEQLLDVAIFRRTPGELHKPLPDGFEDLAAHNLITFKSHHGTLDAWAIKELIGHYVNYRKQVSPSFNDLLPETDFRLIAVGVRFPKGLDATLPLVKSVPGVYDLIWGVDRVRIIVIRELPESDANALLVLFSAQAKRVAEARLRFRIQSPQTSSLVTKILGQYESEGRIMPYTMEDFKREFKRDFIAELTPEERLRGLPPEERLRGLPAEERLRGLPAEERLRGLPVEDRLSDLSDDELRKMQERISKQLNAAVGLKSAKP